MTVDPDDPRVAGFATLKGLLTTAWEDAGHDAVKAAEFIAEGILSPPPARFASWDDALVDYIRTRHGDAAADAAATALRRRRQ
jgi:hypothetical protein